MLDPGNTGSVQHNRETRKILRLIVKTDLEPRAVQLAWRANSSDGSRSESFKGNFFKKKVIDRIPNVLKHFERFTQPEDSLM